MIISKGIIMILSMKSITWFPNRLFNKSYGQLSTLSQLPPASRTTLLSWEVFPLDLEI